MLPALFFRALGWGMTETLVVVGAVMFVLVVVASVGVVCAVRDLRRNLDDNTDQRWTNDV